MVYRVFLSHSSADGVWVQRLAEQARTVGIEVYLAEDDVQAGKYVQEKLQKEIRVCDALVVFVTEHGYISPYVQQEIGAASVLGKLVIPLVEPTTPARDLAGLQGREYIPFDFSHPEVALAHLMAYLQRLSLEKERLTTTPPQPRLQLTTVDALMVGVLAGLLVAVLISSMSSTNA